MDSQWLKNQFDLNPDKSKTALARSLGLEAPAISKILNNTRQIKAHEYIKMRAFFGLPVDGANAAAGPARHQGTLSPLDETGFRDDANTQSSESHWIIPAEILSKRTQAPPGKVKIFQINETLMEPEFRRGEYVLIDLSDTHPSPPGAFVLSDGFGYMMRHCEFVPRSTPPEIVVSACRREFQPQTLALEDVSIIGRVIAKLQWV